MLPYEYQTIANSFAPGALAAAVARHRKPKPKIKCLLPECENLTGHNGGYCCAEHCLKHRKDKKMDAKL